MREEPKQEPPLVTTGVAGFESREAQQASDTGSRRLPCNEELDTDLSDLVTLNTMQLSSLDADQAEGTAAKSLGVATQQVCCRLVTEMDMD